MRYHYSKHIDKNQETANKLREMNGLTERAKDIINTTDINILDYVFGGLETAEEVNRFIEETYTEE